MQHRTQVIINPSSDKGRTKRRWREIRASLGEFIKEFGCEFTEKPNHASDIARQAVRDGAELVIGVGGDGTINEIANGFYEGRDLINPGAALGILPSGTGCDLIRSLNIPRGLRGAARVINEAPTVAMDVGRLTYTGPDGGPRQRLFLNVADFGLGGEVVRRVTEGRLKRKASSYLRCATEAMLRFRSPAVGIRLDGREDLPPGDYLIGAVANGRVFGKGMKIAPDADLTDGLLNAVLVRSMNFLEFLRCGWRLFSGGLASHPKVSCIKTALVEARPLGTDPVLIELDGELVGKLPARFELLGSRLPVKGYLG